MLVKLCNLGDQDKWYFSFDKNFPQYKRKFFSFLLRSLLEVNHSPEVGKNIFS
jgi:hypothetical protein